MEIITNTKDYNKGYKDIRHVKKSQNITVQVSSIVKKIQTRYKKQNSEN